MATTSVDVLGGSTSAGSTSADVLTGLAGDLGWKAPCAAATTGNVALTGLSAIDGFTPSAGNRILVWQQTDATQNGIWNASSGAWTRSLDCDGLGKLVQGTQVAVVNGSLYGGLTFSVTTANPVAIGTGAVNFAQSAFVTSSYVKRDGTTDFTGSQTFRLGTRFATSSGTLRFAWDRTVTETGSGNTGSDLQLSSYADDGVTNLGRVLTVKRSSRVLDFAVAPTVGGASVLATFAASGASHAQGIVPDPGSTAGNQKFLREDATWALPIARGGASGLKVTNNAGTPNTQIDITARSAVIGNPSTGMIYVSSPSVTINLATNQVANGIAESTLKQNSTWYYCYLIAKPDGTVAGLATSSAPPTAPTLPSGYTMLEYVGAVYVFSDGNLRRTLQLGCRAQYKVTSGSANTTVLPSTTSTGSVSMASFVPTSTARVLYGTILLSFTAAPQYCYAAPSSAYTGATAPIQYYYSGNSNSFPQSSGQILLEASTIQLVTTGSGLTFYIQGWDDSVNAT